MDLQAILEKNDFTITLKVEENLGRTLTRVEIEGILSAEGYDLPLANSVVFKIVDSRKHFYIVNYDKDFDKYLVSKPKVV